MSNGVIISDPAIRWNITHALMGMAYGSEMALDEIEGVIGSSDTVPKDVLRQQVRVIANVIGYDYTHDDKVKRP